MSTGREEQGNQAQACHASGFIPVKKLLVSLEALHNRLFCTHSRPERVVEYRTPSCFGNVKSVAQPPLYQISHLIKLFQITTSCDI